MNLKEFTFESFREILVSFQEGGFQIIPVQKYTEGLNPNKKYLILRHDVDRFPSQTLKMAKMEAEMGISATFYFRIVPSVYKPSLIKEVVSLGHEVGYHYEDLTLCSGDKKASIQHFDNYLRQLREFYPIKTICMHGSPLSKWDNKTIWEHFDYKKYGIIADTSIDIDYDQVYYITDNGRFWNKKSVSVRDKVKTNFDIPIHNSRHLCDLAKNGGLPDKVMLNAHPDTFFEYGIKWYLNNAFISTKNVAKWFIVKFDMRK